ncbi:MULTISPECIES: hypothetical protein [Mesorhizobium]|uniref:Uncharacterized protein n=1 Tax=Mesorhizobium shonense TaxID=1209948 RepID=A0ABV2HVD3_9HYPH|nr:hypothetical protein [Mesorhizobium sp.]RWA69064.1 MAG: hypothetical protein EOQ29_17885 [Mesorhizobium sp.]TIS46271.1 MAG: hypothetical protein E5W96_28320 [Mesorhizobium sp.]
MLSHGMADSAQLDILTKALNDYCAKHPAECQDERDREQIAIMVMSLFRRGIEDAEQLSTELERVANGKLARH